MSQLELLCEVKNVTIDAQYGGVEVPEGWPAGTHPYKVTLRYQRRRMTVPFFMGPANTREPSAADVLSCLILDASALDNDFEDWCREYGYDTDSREAERTYKLCVKNARKVTAFLGDDFDLFARAEH